MADDRVFSIPLHTRFRGITVREGVLVEGAAGWGEFSPFLEYDAPTSAPWLACAREGADVGWPSPLRWSVPVNVTVPACSPEKAREIVLASAGCRTARPPYLGQCSGDSAGLPRNSPRPPPGR